MIYCMTTDVWVMIWIIRYSHWLPYIDGLVSPKVTINSWQFTLVTINSMELTNASINSRNPHLKDH